MKFDGTCIDRNSKLILDLRKEFAMVSSKREIESFKMRLKDIFKKYPERDAYSDPNLPFKSGIQDLRSGNS